jgi:hypothetical protein
MMANKRGEKKLNLMREKKHHNTNNSPKLRVKKPE